jgi:hypothetical protein
MKSTPFETSEKQYFLVVFNVLVKLYAVKRNRQFPLINFKTRQGDANKSPQLERAY